MLVHVHTYIYMYAVAILAPPAFWSATMADMCRHTSANTDAAQVQAYMNSCAENLEHSFSLGTYYNHCKVGNKVKTIYIYIYIYIHIHIDIYIYSDTYIYISKVNAKAIYELRLYLMDLIRRAAPYGKLDKAIWCSLLKALLYMNKFKNALEGTDVRNPAMVKLFTARVYDRHRVP